jgi:small ligand-binding sensory domain FIST
MAANGLLLGIVIDPNQPDYERGDFLVRGITGVDHASGSITIGENVRVGQVVRLHVRDARSADADLRRVLDRELSALTAPPAGALVFTCNGRGQGMFGEPDHDAAALDEAFGGAPAAGFFCAGEIGPVGPRNFLHGFTATVAVFAG